jgi:hypothetical protein
VIRDAAFAPPSRTIRDGFSGSGLGLAT